jgi:hypothetical protein
LNVKRTGVGIVLSLAAVWMAACEGPSCATDSDYTLPPVTALGGTPAPAGFGSAADDPARSTPGSGATSATGSTVSATTTTLSPLEAYRAEMRAWKNKYAADLQKDYETVSSMGNPLTASDTEVQAAVDLDVVMAEMVRDLAAIKPPPELSTTHADYLKFMENMADGARRLAKGLTEDKVFTTVRAIASLATTWQKGEATRTAMEQALGFSLSGA